jgi:GNAT superfamily N-acetyltransferase
MAGEQVHTTGGLDVVLDATTEADVDELLDVFRAIVAADEGYPQHPDAPVTRADFVAYWIAPAAVGRVARSAYDGRLLGAYTMKPNGVGRAAHVANAGYVVVADARGQGLGTALVEDSMATARAAGFDTLQFNFVFASNPARRLYERMGFADVGRVPEVIDGEAVHIYWRRL